MTTLLVGEKLAFVQRPDAPPHPTKHPGVLCAVPECPHYHAAPSVIWCRFCPAPATGDDELCDPHRWGVSSAITDPWLAYGAMRANQERKKGARR